MLVRVVVYVLRHCFRGKRPAALLGARIAWTIWVGLALHITGLLPELEALLDGFGFHVGKQRISVLTILQGLLAVAVTVVIAVWAGRRSKGG